ncbi:MAG: hypothetical protein PVH68_11060 [Armatimonadota bacterium]|jgi:hypothetical protein
MAGATQGDTGKAVRERRALPRIPLGPHSVSRLIVGSNPITAGSHLSKFLDRHMREYFTPDTVMQFLAHCEDEGINTWQTSGPLALEYYERYRAEGGTIQYITLEREDPERPKNVEEVVAAGAIGIAHHGEVTDTRFKEGKIDQIRDFLKRVRDAGVLVGLSTHIPAVIEHVEEKSWDVDFYMACVYERHRTKQELKELLGYVPIPVREVYLEEDPPRMCNVLRQTPKPCLAFKILAAGRLCNRRETVEAAFKSTFEMIKPTDAVIVGMYPRFSDQAAENAAFTRKFARPTEDTVA